MFNLLMDLRKGPFEEEEGSQLNMLERPYTRTSDITSRPSIFESGKNKELREECCFNLFKMVDDDTLQITDNLRIQKRLGQIYKLVMPENFKPNYDLIAAFKHEYVTSPDNKKMYLQKILKNQNLTK